MFFPLSANYQVAAWLLMIDDWWRGDSAGANSLVSISGSEEEQHISEADRATENFLKGGDLEGTWRMCP